GGTVTLGGTVVPATFTMTAGTLSGGQVGTAGYSTTLSLANGSISSVLAGSGALTKTTASTVTLNSANTYTGATTVSAGTLADGVANALPTGTALSVTGTFDLGGYAQTVASVTGSGSVTDSGAAATFTVNNAGADTFAGALTGTVALTKT